jgi:hypothetical protein
MDKRRIPSALSLVLVCLLLLFRARTVAARPTTPDEAIQVVTGWLAGNAEPLGVPLGNLAVDVRTVTGEAGAPLYYVVALAPSGFVIVPADDLVEPILSFVDAPAYEPNVHDPLTALVTADVNRRLAEAYEAQAAGGVQILAATQTQERWGALLDKAGTAPGELGILGLSSISDVRVAPFLQTRWSQGDICSKHCFNYFTPNNYPSGCAATAMAQLMYFYRWPLTGIGRHSFTIQVGNREQTATTRGGDGNGGPYQWTSMVWIPACSTTATQRAALGALCYDAGVAIGTVYTPEGSGADAFAVATALKDTFGFTNVVSGANHGRDIGAGLAAMINPNLDAQYPVFLGIIGATGHAAVVDGYGYDLSTNVKTLYHHLNMGWGGYNDIWYNLPKAGDYDTVPVCLYNLFTEGTGEIISGRVTDASGQPVAAALVTADLRSMRYQAATNNKGIYALTHLPSGNSFTVQATKSGLTFPKQTVQTGTSRDLEPTSGNKWPVDFLAARTTN